MNVLSVSLKCALQRKREENVFKIFTEEILERTHRKRTWTNLKISIPANY